MNFPYQPSVLAQLAEKTNMPSNTVRVVGKAIAELPPSVRDELLETLRRPTCSQPRNATLIP